MSKQYEKGFKRNAVRYRYAHLDLTVKKLKKFMYYTVRADFSNPKNFFEIMKKIGVLNCIYYRKLLEG